MRETGVANLALRGLKSVLRPAKRKLWRPVPRAEKDYATHIPVLVGLARAIKVERVLELGCGQYSTLTFLNHEAFPSLTSLHTIETDQDWLDRISAVVVDDPRVRTRLIDGRMRSVIEQMNLDDYDLIFVDDSTSAEDRAATIKAISAARPKKAVVAIHDFEIQAYREAARTFRYQFTFKALNPQTGIVWNNRRNLMNALRQTSATIKHHSKTIHPDDVSGWEVALSSKNPRRSSQGIDITLRES